MKPASPSAALPPLLLLLVVVVVLAAVSPADGSWHQSPAACRACCSAISGAYCPSWCPPCQTQCPAPQLTSCPIVPEPEPRRCLNSGCPSGQRCCFNGCRVVCQPVCRAPCPPGQRCILDCQHPPCSATPRCAPIHLPTCRTFHCPSGYHCVLSGGRPKCEQSSSSRPGTCPANDLLSVTTCLANAQDQCSEDNSCGRNQKCCSYGCARTCVPACLPACGSDQKCVLKRPPGPCQGKTCDPPVSTCELKDPCAVVRCGFNTQCVVRDGKARCEPPNIVEEPGVCPINDIITTCEVREDACFSDAECSRGEKCCSRGCGRTCMPACSNPCPHGQTCKNTVVPCLVPPCPEYPRCVVDHSMEELRVCPLNDIIGTCHVREDTCTFDAQCKRTEKCCSRGCGRTCVPTCPSPCPRGETCRIPNVQCFAPPCNPSAHCVVDDSVEKPGVCPISDIITTCEVREDACFSDAECSRGEKCCSRGCGRTCVPVCPSPCPHGQTCKIPNVQCYGPSCNQTPRCVVDVSVEKPGVCPLDDIITTCQVRVDACSSDSQCESGQKCCSRGCGRTCVAACKTPCSRGEECKLANVKCLVPPCPSFSECQPVHGPVVRPGSCPRDAGPSICLERRDACTSDAQCLVGQKCCTQGCGRKCVTIQNYRG